MKNILILLTTVLAGTSAAQAEWTFTTSDAWAWTASAGWIYLSDVPDKVWSAEAQEWQMNPMKQSAVDITAIEARTPWTVRLAVGEQTWELVINKSGLKNGTFSYGENIYDVAWASMTDDALGRALVYVESASAGFPATFALELDFDTSQSGHYRLIGNLGTSLDPFVRLSGAFTMD